MGYIDLNISSGSDPLEIVQRYQNSGFVEIAEVNTIGEYTGNSNDSLFSDQWHLNNTSDIDIDAPEAWGYDTGDPDVIIGILDSGTDVMHEDLQSNIWVNPGEDEDGDGVVWDTDDLNGIDDDGNGRIDDLVGWDFVNDENDVEGPFYHGTHVAGIAGAVTNNNKGIAGVSGGWTSSAPGSNLLICGVGDNAPSGAALDDAILYAASKGADIITMSLGVGSSSAIDAAIASAYLSYGCFIDCASGNNNSDSVRYPANNEYVVAVGATNQSDQKPSFSDYGSNLDLAAPGVEIWSTRKNDTYAEGDGTSYAAPMVAGLAGLLLSHNPSYSNEDILEILATSCEKVGGYTYSTNHDKSCSSWSNELGYGRINAYYAVAPPSAPQNLEVSSVGYHPQLNWDANIEPDVSKYQVWRKKDSGSWVLKATVSTNSYNDDQVITPVQQNQFYYKVRARDTQNYYSSYSNVVSIDGYQIYKEGGIAENKPQNHLPEKFSLSQNYPNPFNPTTQIKVDLPEAGITTIKVFNIQGKLIQTLVNSHTEAGYYTFGFNGDNLSSGIYMYEIKSGRYHQIKRMLLIK